MSDGMSSMSPVPFFGDVMPRIFVYDRKGKRVGLMTWGIGQSWRPDSFCF